MSKSENAYQTPENRTESTSTNRTSQLGPALCFKGELSGSEDVIMLGEFQGTVNLANNNLIIDNKSKVKAEIRVKNITVKGSVEGNISATGKVLIEQQGQMIGDISASRISIMEGAQFKGSVKIINA